MTDPRTSDRPPPTDRAAPPTGGLAGWTYRTARRVIVAVVGTTLLLLGLVMLIGPGPGVVVLGGGLALLATEFVWARVWLSRIKSAAERGADEVAYRLSGDRTPRAQRPPSRLRRWLMKLPIPAATPASLQPKPGPSGPDGPT